MSRFHICFIIQLKNMTLMNFKTFITAVAIGAAVYGAGQVYGKYKNENLSANMPAASSLFKQTNYTENSANTPTVDFEYAAAKASPAVVHIKVMQRGRSVNSNPFAQNNQQGNDDGNGTDGMSYQGEGSGSERQVASGSGVAISADGYIVTNNHVVDKAEDLVVTLNDKKDYKAKVIGTDPSSDLAVIKIEANNLSYLNFANSDDVRVGQWVLAIGYPLNLETTVTSGIVSAKARSIGINSHNSNSPIESFIQTDAAVNPGNSGGALVNTKGELIGINSAIASPTGSYAGYSYAIPSNLVGRVAGDIIKYGSAKRAYLGVMFSNDKMSEADRQKNNIPEGTGVYVMDVTSGSAAEEAGLQKGDFIIKINGNTINTGTEMVEKISALRPGNKVEITFTHNGSATTATGTLKGESASNRQPAQPTENNQPDEGDGN
jgi:serine protease Do